MIAEPAFPRGRIVPGGVRAQGAFSPAQYIITLVGPGSPNFNFFTKQLRAVARYLSRKEGLLPIAVNGKGGRERVQNMRHICSDDGTVNPEPLQSNAIILLAELKCSLGHNTIKWLL